MASYHYYLISGLCYRAKSKSDCCRFSVRFIFRRVIIRAHGIIERKIYIFFKERTGERCMVEPFLFARFSVVILILSNMSFTDPVASIF